MSGSHGMSGSAASRNKRALTIVFFTTLAYLVAEVIGGWWTGSLALLADAGHMLTDVAGVGLALLAIRFGEKPATPERTYGYYRFEILAALTNAVVLILISLYILYEAYFRFLNPPKVESTTMMWVAGVGMLVNLYGVYLLRKSSGESLNMKGAYFEVLVGPAYVGGRANCRRYHAHHEVVLRRPAALGRHRPVHSAPHLGPAQRVGGRAAGRHPGRREPGSPAPGPAGRAGRGGRARPARLGAHLRGQRPKRPRCVGRRCPARRACWPAPMPM